MKERTKERPPADEQPKPKPKPKPKPPAAKAKVKFKAASGDDVASMLADIRKVDGVDTEGAQLMAQGNLSLKLKGVIPTPAIGLNAAIGRGGIPRGRLTILHGAEGCGKTTLLLHLMSECQNMGGLAVYMDLEYKLDVDYAEVLGVNMDSLFYVTPKYLEAVFAGINAVVERVQKMRAKGFKAPVMIALDSMNAAITKAEFNGDWEDQHISPSARVYSRLLPKLMPTIHRNDIALVFVSQMRKKMGVMFGDDAEISGGNSPKHHAVLILGFNRGAAKKNREGERDRNKVYCKVKKNQIAIPFKETEFDIIYGKGIDAEESLMKLAMDKKYIKQDAGRYKVRLDRSAKWADIEAMAHGADELTKLLREDTEGTRTALEAVLRKELGWS